MVNALCGVGKVGGKGFGDVHELPGVAVGEGEPGALNLDEETVSFAEGVVDVGHEELDAIGLVGGEGGRGFEASAELAAEGFAADELLATAHFRGFFVDEGREVAGVDVDGAGDGEILFEGFRLKD